jgi:cytochrome c-type biogenesis protein CcmH
MKKSLLAALLLCAAIAAAQPAPSLAAQGSPAPPTRAQLPDIEDEVMCPTCGVPLALAFSPQAERERNFIRRQIALGKTKDEIKDALVAEFGAGVLALPDTGDSSFNWAAYLIPAGAVIVAAIVLVVALRRWRRRTAAAEGRDEPDLTAEQSERLERDLSRYDSW